MENNDFITNGIHQKLIDIVGQYERYIKTTGLEGVPLYQTIQKLENLIQETT